MLDAADMGVATADPEYLQHYKAKAKEDEAKKKLEEAKVKAADEEKKKAEAKILEEKAKQDAEAVKAI